MVNRRMSFQSREGVVVMAGAVPYFIPITPGAAHKNTEEASLVNPKKVSGNILTRQNVDLSTVFVDPQKIE